MPVHTSSAGPSRRIDQSSRTSTARCPPGIRTVTRRSVRPFLTAAQATPHAEDPDVERVTRVDAGELHVRAIGERGVALDQRAEAPDLRLVQAGDEDDAVGV